MSKRAVCLFVINGLGLGNSTRCHAIISRLPGSIEIHVLTSGNGLYFFENRPEIASLTPMEALQYSSTADGGISALGTVAQFGNHIKLIRKKSRQLDGVLERLRPDFAVTDSEYGIWPLKKRRIPVIALNNADVVAGEYLSRETPGSVKAHFWSMEYPDYLFHKYLADVVISPALTPSAPRHPRIRRTGLIVRDDIRKVAESRSGLPFPAPKDVRRAVFMLSGSAFAADIKGDFASLPFHIDVIGRDGVNTTNVTWHGKTRETAPILAQADILAINAGFSAVSEAVALRKPVFVIPVPNHAEQWINAMLVRELGRGEIVTDRTLIPRLKDCFEKNRWEGFQEFREADFTGADQAARHIDYFAGSNRPCFDIPLAAK